MKYLDWKHDAGDRWVVDTETDGLSPTRFWCAVAQNLGTNEVIEFGPEEMYDGRFRRFFSSIPIAIGHNFVSYDNFHLGRLLDSDKLVCQIIDSLVLSYLYWPHLPGGHSLEAYGERFGLPKLEHSDWDHFSPEMMARCQRDVELNVKVYKGLCRRMNKIGFSEKSCEIEHKIRAVIDKQQRRGFYFDREKAEGLVDEFEQKLDGLSEPVQILFPPVLSEVKTFNRRRRKDGSNFSSYERHLEEYDAVRDSEDGSQYSVFNYKSFDIASPKQRVEKLLSLGWEPTQFTEAGNPKIDEDTLRAYAQESGRPEITAIADWVVLSSRKSMVEGWLKVLGDDSRIHGTIMTCGAATRRMRHLRPNTANIPKASEKVAYGKELRGLWSTADKENRCLVGYDASGLEMRGFGHYIGGGPAANLYITGDPHQYNCDNLNAASIQIDRHDCKTEFYAFLYGAGDEKLGKIIKGRRGIGKRIREVLLTATPELGRAAEEIKEEFNSNNGLLECIDGGYVRCEYPHAALNYKIQSAGGIVMKLASIKFDEWLVRNNIDAWKVNDVHDEAQQDSLKECAREVGENGVRAIKEAGEELNFKVPLTGEYKMGQDWSTTH